MHQDAKGGGIIKSYLINGGKPVVKRGERTARASHESRWAHARCSTEARARLLLAERVGVH